MKRNTKMIAGGLTALFIIGLSNTSLAYAQSMPYGSVSDCSMKGSGMDNAMDEMVSGLQGKQGDDFDQAFLSEMIMHHQGAIEMAQMALKDAGHPEIKQMAQNIISTQTGEVQQMQHWLQSWYGTNNAV